MSPATTMWGRAECHHHTERTAKSCRQGVGRRRCPQQVGFAHHKVWALSAAAPERARQRPRQPPPQARRSRPPSSCHGHYRRRHNEHVWVSSGEARLN